MCRSRVYDRFLKRFTEFAKNVKLGDGLDKDTTMGPLANPRRLDAMEAIVKDSKSRGGKIVTGGKRHGNQGYFFEPTVITDVPDDCKIMTEEPFGPVAPIVRVQDLRRSGRAGQFAAVRPCGLCLHHHRRRPRP